MTKGWMDGVEHIPTAAYGYSSTKEIMPIAVVDHIMQGYQSTMIRWAQERPPEAMKSAHFTISRDGRIIQHVSIFDPAWHAGRVMNPSWPLLKPGTNPNHYTVGIEHEGFSVPPGYGYDYCYDAAHPWPEPMVQATIKVHRWVCEQAGIKPSTDTIIGHRAIDSVTRLNDPGSAWPQARIIAALQPPVPLHDLPPKAGALDWASFYTNGAKPVRVEQQNPTTVRDVYEVFKYRKVK